MPQKQRTSNISQDPLFKEIVQLKKNLDRMNILLGEKDETIASLNATIASLTETNQKLMEQLEVLLDKQDGQQTQLLAMAEQLRLLSGKHFGIKSEKRSSKKKSQKKDENDHHDDDSSQTPGGSAGSDSTLPKQADQDQPVSEKPSTHRPITKKKSRTRKPKPSFLEQIKKLGIVPEKVLCELSGKELECPSCGSTMQPFGEKHLRYELIVSPVEIRVKDYVGVTYRCENCHQRARDARTALDQCSLKPVTAPSPPAVLPGALASPALLAMVICLKILYQLPASRILTILRDWGRFTVSSSTLSSWIIQASQIYFEPIYNRLKEILLQSSVLQADETSLRVINESITRQKTKSFIWQYRTGECEPVPIVLFEYCQGRGGKYAASFLRGFDGILLVDGYAGYNQVEMAKLAYCWVHARRYFIEASMCSRDKDCITLADQVLDVIDQLFDIEQEICEKDLSLPERMALRHQKTLPLVDSLFGQIRPLNLAAFSSEKLRKACSYLLNHEEGLRVFLDDPSVPAHNNAAEEAFVSIARGRHNWLFAYSEEGAKALAVLSSIAKTAKLWGRNVLEYFQEVMEKFKPWASSGVIPKEIIESVIQKTNPVPAGCLNAG